MWEGRMRLRQGRRKRWRPTQQDGLQVQRAAETDKKGVERLTMSTEDIADMTRARLEIHTHTNTYTVCIDKEGMVNIYSLSEEQPK